MFSYNRMQPGTKSTLVQLLQPNCKVCGQTQKPSSPADIQSGRVITAATPISWAGYRWKGCSFGKADPQGGPGQHKMADTETLYKHISIIHSLSAPFCLAVENVCTDSQHLMWIKTLYLNIKNFAIFRSEVDKIHKVNRDLRPTNGKTLYLSIALV